MMIIMSMKMIKMKIADFVLLMPILMLMLLMMKKIVDLALLKKKLMLMKKIIDLVLLSICLPVKPRLNLFFNSSTAESIKIERTTPSFSQESSQASKKPSSSTIHSNFSTSLMRFGFGIVEMRKWSCQVWSM